MWFRYVGGFIFVLTVAIFVSQSPVHAEWRDTADSLTIEAPVTYNNGKEPTVSSKNRDCLPSLSSFIEDIPSGCRTQTGYGQVIESLGGASLVRNGTGRAGEVSGLGRIIPIPSSSNLLTMHGDSYMGHRLYLHRNVSSRITTTRYRDNVYHHIDDSGGELLLSKPDDSGVRIHSYSNAFSSSGEWMVSDAARHGLVRLNTRTGQDFYFGEMTGGKLKSAISANGDYVAVANEGHKTFRLYDLRNCQLYPDSNYHHDCPYIDLEEVIKRDFPTFLFVDVVRFRTNDSLYVKMVVNLPQSGNREFRELFIMNENGTNDSSVDYIALGDSFASGEGAFVYKPGTDTTESKCHLSTISYPFLLAAHLSMTTYDSVACSGAVVDDVWNREPQSYQGQIDNVATEDRSDSEIELITGSFNPGYLNQSTFIHEYKPKNVSVSMGGNDIGFDDILKTCVMPGTCYDSIEDRIELATEIDRQIPRLKKAYNNLSTSGHTNTKLYVIGYPQIAKPSGRCDINVLLNQDELVFAQHLISYLNDAVEIAARQAGVYFVDVEDAFYRHRLCEYTAVPAMHGVTAGNDQIEFLQGPVGQESYHPTAFGNRLLRDAVLERTNNFTMSMPEPVIDTWFEDATTIQNLYDTSPRGYEDRQVSNTHRDDQITISEAAHGDMLPINTMQDRYTLQSDQTYQIWLHSEPTLLGTTKTDERGVIDTHVEIPSTVTPGYHSLKIVGEDVLGEATVIHKTVFIAEEKEHLAPPEDESLPLPEPDFQPDNPKPPTDSPETEAGAEQSNEQQPENDAPEDETTREDGANTIQSDQPTTVVLENAARSSATTEVEAEPQIAGATDNKSLAQNTADSSEQVAQTDTTEADATNTTWLGALLILLTLSGLSFVIYKVARK